MGNYCGKCGTRLDRRTGLCPKCNAARRKRLYFSAAAGLVLVAAVILCILFLPGRQTPDGTAASKTTSLPLAAPKAEDTPAARKEPTQIARPVLKADHTVTANQDGTSKAAMVYTVFGSEIDKGSIASLQFLDTLADAPENTWDVSEAGDGSVLAWVSPKESGQYDLYIAGEGGVWAPEDSAYLFAGYRWMESLDFNNAFFVENCRTMQGMFSTDQLLTGLDFSGWDTASVTDMSEMFYFCSSLRELDVSGFDTSSVTDMNAMFERCESLQALDLSSFDTASVTNMSSMFFQCMLLEKLDLSSFDTSRVTDMSGMFYSCALKDLDLSSFDTASVEEITWFLSGGTILNTLQVGQKFDLSLLRNEVENNPDFMAGDGTINGQPWKSFFLLSV